MLLDDALYADVIGSINVTGRDAPRADDRRLPRVRLAGELPVHFGGDLDTGHHLRVRDLSAGGVGLLHGERVSLDEAVVVHLPRSGDRSSPVLGRVVYWEPLAAGSYAIGVRFEQVLSTANWVAEAAAAVANDRATARPSRPSLLRRLFARPGRLAA